MKTQQYFGLTVMKVISWVVFIGLCIQAGTLLVTFGISIWINADAAKNLYEGLDLSALYAYNFWYYVHAVSFLAFVAIMKAYLLYLVICIFSELNLVKPFSLEIHRLISKIAYLAVQVGILMVFANQYLKWLGKRDAEIPYLGDFLVNGVDFLILGGVIYVISLVFERGIDLQSENDLTI